MGNASYVALIKDFLSSGAIDPPPVLAEDPGLLEFRAGEFTCTVFPLQGKADLGAADDGAEPRIVIQSEVMRLDQLAAEQARSVMRLLHELNWAARVGNGIMAMIDANDTVVVSATMEIRLMDGRRLSEEMAAVLGAAENMSAILQVSPGPQPTALDNVAANPSFLGANRYA